MHVRQTNIFPPMSVPLQTIDKYDTEADMIIANYQKKNQKKTTYYGYMLSNPWA